MHMSAPVYELKRKAKALAREENIPFHQALDRVAVQQGFARWSLLAAKYAQISPADKMFAHLAPGDVALIAARPGQGKTLFSLELAVAAIHAGKRAWFFSLEFTELDVFEALRELGVAPEGLGARLNVDCSDDIHANYIVESAGDAASGDVIVVDYLQILDQRRTHPDLATQVARLHAFSRERGAIVVFISQIDRAYDPQKKLYPDLADVRLPNAIDLALFNKSFFLANGAVRFSKAA